MANELTQLPNPDNIPGAVSSGYQRQNTNFFALMAGYNSIKPYMKDDTIIIPAGGIVEVNGVLYAVTTEARLTIPDNRNYFILLSGSKDNMTPALTEDHGTFSHTKNGWYNSNNERILWIEDYDHQPTRGTLISNNTGVGESKILTLEAGLYWAEIIGGGGGNGGSSDNRTGINGEPGGYLKTSFFLPNKSDIEIFVGGIGSAGGDGSYYSGLHNGKGGIGGIGDGEDGKESEYDIQNANTYWSPGGGGGGGGYSFIIIQEIGLILIAGGGGGGGAGAGSAGLSNCPGGIGGKGGGSFYSGKYAFSIPISPGGLGSVGNNIFSPPKAEPGIAIISKHGICKPIATHHTIVGNGSVKIYKI